MQQQVTMAMPLLEAVEHAALRAGVPVDARVESGRTPIHALKRLWETEHFDRIVVPAAARGHSGFAPKDLDLDADPRAERDPDPQARSGPERSLTRFGFHAPITRPLDEGNTAGRHEQAVSPGASYLSCHAGSVRNSSSVS